MQQEAFITRKVSSGHNELCKKTIQILQSSYLDKHFWLVFKGRFIVLHAYNEKFKDKCSMQIP